MFKKIILTFLVLIFSLFSLYGAFADSIPVENIFLDITSDYKYINELQTLYDRGMISPDSEGKFNPRALLNRDEFVGILMEVTCKECIQPNTALDILNKFEDTALFYDINKENKYFYCIAGASDQGFVSGYHESTICDDGTYSEGEKPFCAANTIILEEAIAVILRASGILSNAEAEQIRQDIFDGKITESLSDDVSPKNLDGSVYSFYPDLQKALEFEVKDVDKDGNIKTYTLIDIIDGKIRPKQTISKEMFLKIAYVTLKANSCEEKNDANLAFGMIIYDQQCSEGNSNCKESTFDTNTDTYDFSENVYTTCEDGIAEPEGYIWRFYNIETGEEIKKYGKYIDNYKFLSSGDWKVFLRVIDNCGNTGEVSNTLNIDNLGLKVSLIADPIYGEGPLKVDFEGIVGGGESPFTYFWNFGDSNDGFGKFTENIFKQEGTYETTLQVTDIKGRIGNASAYVEVIGNNKCGADSDLDGINDCLDLCPLINGSDKNKGCPMLEKECNPSCDDGYACSEKNVCLPEIISNSCEYTGGDVLFGNMICNSCPCNYFLDFTSTLRKCDIIFPAITSPDSKNIYSKGELYQID